MWKTRLVESDCGPNGIRLVESLIVEVWSYCVTSGIKTGNRVIVEVENDCGQQAIRLVESDCGQQDW